jgi:tRNA(Ile)-lysidine synthase
MRPLIDCARTDVHAFAREHTPEIAWDASNDDLRFERTRVRKVLLPALRDQDPALEAHLAHLADEARECAAFLDGAAQGLLMQARIDPETLSISAFHGAAPALCRAALRAWLGEQVGPIGAAQLRQVMETCRRGRGEVWLSAQHRVVAGSDGTLRLQLRVDGGSPTAP